MFVGLPGLGTFAFAGYHDRAHAEVVQGVVDAFLAVAAVGSDGARCAPGSLGDPRDRRRQLRRVGGAWSTALLPGVAPYHWQHAKHSPHKACVSP